VIPHELAIRLVAIRQASLEPRPEARSLGTAYRDELTVAAAWLQTRPDVLEGVLNVLVSEIATSRRDLGLPLLPAPAWSFPVDRPVELEASPGIPPELLALVDRMAAIVYAEAPQRWVLGLELDDGEVTARPAEVGP
jgi:hypothetical protein